MQAALQRRAAVAAEERASPVDREGLIGEIEVRPRHAANPRTMVVGFLARERSLLWALLRRRIRLNGPPKLLVSFGKCFPS